MNLGGGDQRVAKNRPTSSGRAQNVKDIKTSLDNAKKTNNIVGTTVGNILQNLSDNVRSNLNSAESSGIQLKAQVQMLQDNTRVEIPKLETKNK